MSAADVRDVLDIPQGTHGEAAGGRRPPAKKQKTVEKRPDGITRELYALLGENPPPVSLKLESRFKERPKWQEKAKPWEWRAFVNPARKDGLVLRHWASASPKPSSATGNGVDGEKSTNKGRKQAGNRKRITFDDEQLKAAEASADAMDIDTEEPSEDSAAAAATGEDTDSAVVVAEKLPEQDYPFARFDIQPNVLQYTEEEYAAVGVSDDWSRAETDYLFDLCREYDLRFFIIADRYDYRPAAPRASGNGETDGALPATPTPPPRSMEDIKHRYYTLTRALLILRTPRTHLTPEQSQYLQLLNFDKEKEAARKRTALALFNRTPEEVKEEELLLVEMKRILANQERLFEERQDLFSRLDAPVATGSIAAYTGSAGLQALGALLASGAGGNTSSSNAGTTSSSSTTNPAHAAAGDKAGASAAAAAAAATSASSGGPGDKTAAKKRKSVGSALGIDTGLASSSSANDSRTNQTPTTAATATGTSTSTPTAAAAPTTHHHHKKSLSTSTDKASLATPTSSTTRTLTADEERQYGVAYHEKIASGVYLRSSKVASVKGSNQPKVQTALHELGIPGKLTMATTKTCAKMEALNQAVSMLLDAKKLSEKLDAELKVEMARLENV
ncbi:hypothetical protein DFH27DRAFT_542120 [Peziza echinospora]|nr:hypothetical protein DFH27DRAFT_542120 [Peziza echinospora]